MANDYCTITELYSANPDSGMDNANYATVLTALITRASRMIDTATRRTAGAYYASTDETTRYFTGSGCSQQWVDEMAAAPSYVGLAQGGGVQSSDYTTMASSDYFLWPDNSSDTNEPYRRIDFDTINGAYSTWYKYRKSVKITCRWGYSTSIPDYIKEMTIIQASRWFKRSHIGYADAAAIPELSQIRYTKLDPDVEEGLKHYRRLAI